MTEVQCERIYQDGRLAADKDHARSVSPCPYPAGTDEAKWWRRGYDEVVLMAERVRAGDQRRELGAARELLRELQETLRATVMRYELELSELRAYLSQRAAFQAKTGEIHAALERLRGLID